MLEWWSGCVRVVEWLCWSGGVVVLEWWSGCVGVVEWLCWSGGVVVSEWWSGCVRVVIMKSVGRKITSSELSARAFVQ